LLNYILATVTIKDCEFRNNFFLTDDALTGPNVFSTYSTISLENVLMENTEDVTITSLNGLVPDAGFIFSQSNSALFISQKSQFRNGIGSKAGVIFSISGILDY
jgi:hypothetical protein